MNKKVVKTKATDGSLVEYVVSDSPPSGAMKYIYFAPDKSYVVAFFKTPQDANAKSRLENITGKYRNDIFGQIGGDYWKDLFCWPDRIVEHEGKTGITVPTYAKQFFFELDPALKGKEKEGKWFASAKLMKQLAPVERGDWLSYLKICLKLSRAVKRMHSAGLAHSDLSYKNVLIDPHGGSACIIDVDGLVVPGKFPPDVLGTPDFIAPEVLCSVNAAQKNQRILPSRTTDLHALAVLIYMYLLHRHPLRGGRYFGDDVDDEESMMMGSHSLFIENPLDKSNRNMKREYGDQFNKSLPWVDLDNFSAGKVCGPFLSELFGRAFIDGLKNPMARPIANVWEMAIVKTTDRLQPCSNPNCEQKWYVFDGSREPKCPFCGTAYKGLLPMLNFYSSRPGSTGAANYQPENYQLMVFNGQSLYNWHVNKNIFPNERLAESDKKRVGYFILHQGKWLLVNETLRSLYEISSGGKTLIPPGAHIVLEDNKQILLSTEDGGRLVLIQMAGK